MNLQTKSWYPWVIWGLAAAFFFSEYFARVAPSVMVAPLMSAFRVHGLQLGILSAFFYYAYVGMQLPVGTLTDRLGPRRLLTAAALLCGVSAFLFASSHSLVTASASRFLMGVTAAFAFVGALKIASVWFPPHRFGFLAGSTQALGMLGAAVGEGPVAVLVSHVGWRPTMMIIGAILVALAGLIAIFVRDKPNQHKNKAIGREPVLTNLYIVLANRQTWVNGLVVGFLYAPTAAFAELWGADYFEHTIAISTDVAASAISLIFIGWGISSPLVGLLSDHIGKRKPIIMGSIIASMIIMSIALYLPGLPRWSIFVLMFMYGAANVGVATCYAVACEQNELKVSATAMAFANMASVLIGASFQPVIGWLLDLGWTHQFAHGAPFYSAHDFHMAMLALPACFVLSFIACLFLTESGPKER